MDSLEGINYRILNANEFYREDIIEIFESNKSSVPNPASTSIQVAEKDGKVIGISVLQPQYHAEPIWIHEEYRNTMLHKYLIEAMLQPLTKLNGLRLFIFAPDSKIVKLAARFGFKQKDYTVMERTF